MCGLALNIEYYIAFKISFAYDSNIPDLPVGFGNINCYPYDSVNNVYSTIPLFN